MSNKENEIKLTPSQEAAVNFGKGNLLVSAAAGSGKTFTLAERVLHLLTDQNSDASIDKMLIVTFTKASANDLKTKIRKTLQKKLKETPDDKKLKLQLAKLSNAQIGTIHSYCLKLIKSHFNELNLSPEMRVCDEIESEILKKEVMRNVVNTYYSNIENGTISSLLADTLNGSKSEEKLDEILLDFVNSLISHGYSVNKLDEYEFELRKAENGGFLTSPQGLATKDYILRKTAYIKTILNYYKDELIKINSGHPYLKIIYEILDYVSRIDTLLETGNYTNLQQHLSEVKFGNLAKLQENDICDASLEFKDYKSKIVESIKKIKADFFSMSIDEVNNSIKVTADICHNAKPLIEEFISQYSKAKKDRGILDYSDLEYYSCQLLYDENDNLTNVAEIEAKKYDYVFIDEYQDTNYIQDKIFYAIGSECGRFLVGDIKQSIYRFRGAESNIFASYRNKWQSKNDPKGSSIFLQDNYRCDKNIVDFANLVSNHIFQYSSINYTPSDDLVHSKTTDYGTCPVEIHLLIKDNTNNNLITEPDYVALKINELLSEVDEEGNPKLKGKDIAIILRTTTKAYEYEEALNKYGIKSNLSTSEDFFSQPEVLLAICLLNAVDNPNRDEYLCGAMRSPVFGFTTDELIEIRTATVDTTLWQAVKAYNIDEALKEKCDAFIQKLNSLRKSCNQLKADKAVRLIFQETNIYELNFDNSQAKSNLILLYDMARKYESGVFAGLYGFLNHIHELLSKENSNVEAIKADDINSVNITTIHKSKGLEYEVCFLSEMSHQFNYEDTKNNLIYDTDFGLATKIADESGLANYDTPVRKAASVRITNAMIEEEMRILYVALTRAKGRLFITSSSKEDPNEIIKARQLSSRFDSKEQVFTVKNYISWILDSIYVKGFVPPKFVDIFTIGQDKSEAFKFTSESIINGDTPKNNTQINNTFVDDKTDWDEFLNERLNFQYPSEYKRLIPSTLSISQLRPDSLDKDPTIQYKIQKLNEENSSAPTPSFLSGEPGYSAATKGTAAHTFLEYCDFENVINNGIDSELNRLIKEEFITKEVSKLINKKQMNNFFKTDIFARMRKAKMLKREFDFVSTIAASELTLKPKLKALFNKTDEKALLHGVIDCIFEDENGKLVILDYKTDRFSEPYISEDKYKLIDIMRGRHENQLKYYAKIASKIFDRPVDEVYVYSFSLNELIKIN